MTDQRLRDLERDVAHGDLQAQARLLLERVRVGDLTEERLGLAAYLGNEAARGATGGTVILAATVTTCAGLRDWAINLRPWGREVCVRAAVGAADSIQHLWERRCPDRGEPRRAMEAARAWLGCPCSQHADAAAAAGVAAGEVGDQPPASRGATMAARAAGSAAQETLYRWTEHDGGGWLGVALEQVQTAKGRGKRGASYAVRAATEELIRWALASRGSST